MGPYILLNLLMLCRVDADRILKSTGHFQTYNKLSRAEVPLNLKSKNRKKNWNLKSVLLDVVEFSLCLRFKTFRFLSKEQIILSINDKVIQ